MRPVSAFTLDDLAEVWARTPLIADLRPGGHYVAKDVYDIEEASNSARLTRWRHLHGECLTVARADPGRVGGCCSGSWRKGGADTRAGLSPNGGLVVLKGNLLSGRALIKVAGLKALTFTGRPWSSKMRKTVWPWVRERTYARVQ